MAVFGGETDAFSELPVRSCGGAKGWAVWNMLGAMASESVAAVDLFCGAGGLSCGLQQAGIKVVAGVDVDPSCRWPFERNIEARFVHESVREVTGSDLDGLWGDGDSHRLLAGCAPCQPFSSQRRGADSKSHEAWDLLLEFGRLVAESRPDFVTMENVVPLKSAPVFGQFLGGLAHLGYFIDFKAVRGVDHGLPQTRRRLVLTASLKGFVPIPDRTVPEGQVSTVRDAIAGLPPLAAGQTDPDDPLHCARALTPINLRRRVASRPGGTWRDWPEELRAACHRRATGSSFQSFYGVMEWDAPSPTITTQYHNYGSGRFGHPEQMRTITPREAALLQGFPPDYQFLPPGVPVRFTTLGKMIGNAVPPAFGALVGRAILDAVACPTH